MSEREILQSLQEATLAAVAASSVPELPVKYLGRTFPIPNDQKYLEVVHIVNNRPNAYWGEERFYQGALRLILHWPNNDAGVYEPMNVLASVASFFTKAKTFGTVKIYDVPTAGSIIEGGTETLFPVTIPYRSFRPTEG